MTKISSLKKSITFIYIFQKMLKIHQNYLKQSLIRKSFVSTTQFLKNICSFFFLRFQKIKAVIYLFQVIFSMIKQSNFNSCRLTVYKKGLPELQYQTQKVVLNSSFHLLNESNWSLEYPIMTKRSKLKFYFIHKQKS